MSTSPAHSSRRSTRSTAPLFGSPPLAPIGLSTPTPAETSSSSRPDRTVSISNVVEVCELASVPESTMLPPPITLPMTAPPNVDPIVTPERAEQPQDVTTPMAIEAGATSSSSVEPVTPGTILKQPTEDFYQISDASTRKRRRAVMVGLEEEILEQIKVYRRMEGNPEGAKLALHASRLAGNELEDLRRTLETEAYYEALQTLLEQRPPRLPYRDREMRGSKKSKTKRE
ncbi:hypothetical protein BGZ54_004791 [Gamsiella multidivaricata]|nr:hypothetical protein BGZ54_004791 [Gamsiella multidivaricata]